MFDLSIVLTKFSNHGSITWFPEFGIDIVAEEIEK